MKRPNNRSLEDMEVGDILVDKDGDETKVLAVLPLGGVFLESCVDDFESVGGWDTFIEAKEHGKKIKDQPEEELIEVTLQEVADKMGVDVEKLRIKEN